MRCRLQGCSDCRLQVGNLAAGALEMMKEIAVLDYTLVPHLLTSQAAILRGQQRLAAHEIVSFFPFRPQRI